MPVQPINYAAMPLRNGAENIMSGFNAAFGPVAASRKAEADKLAAQMLQMQIQNEPTKQEYERALKEAQTKKILQEVNLFSAILGENPPSMASADNPQAQSQNSIAQIFGPDARSELIRVMAGLGPLSPAQQQQMQIDTNKANTDYQTENTLKNPTSTTLNRLQRLSQMAVPMLNSYIELSNNAHDSIYKARAGIGIFDKNRINAAEPTQILKNFSSGEGGFEKAEKFLTPSIGESAEEYQARLYNTVHELLPQIEESYRVAGQETPQEVYDLLEQLKPKPKEIKENPIKNASIPEGKPAFVEMILDGEVYDIPYNHVTEAFQKGFKIAPQSGGKK